MKKSLPLLLCSLAACSPTPDESQAPAIQQTGVNLRADVLADTDVAGMGYTITPVDCDTGLADADADIIQLVRDLEDILLPGGHPGFEGQPFDPDSTHLFADAFQALPAGCYDVLAQPLDADGQPSADCEIATASNVEVVPEQVTEVLLISQCDTPSELGALDAIVALNHGPALTDAWYDPSKFTCQGSTTLCVAATDADNDPLVLIPSAEDGVTFNVLPAEINEQGQTVQCVEVSVPGPGEYAISLNVFDQAFDAEGQLVTIESLLNEGQTSHATITLPVHSMAQEACICSCPDGFTLNADSSACERNTVADAVFNGDTMPVCEGDDDAQYGALGARFPGGLTVQNTCFGQNFVDSLGRLNAVGIWACRATGRDEWIGFSTCITVEEAGEYVVGTAGDDQSRIIIDGQPVFSQAGQASFRTWWMVPVQLTPGVHVIEMQGQDSGGQLATLGAEIYGPFPAGSTVDDQTMAALDYENNIFWTTGDQLGGEFQTGTNTGYSCPDGTSLNLCGDVPTCTGREVLACQ